MSEAVTQATPGFFPTSPLPTAPDGDEDDGLRIVLTPVQLAAILQGATISEGETFTGRLLTRAFSGLSLIFGAAELVGAGALFAAPEPTMLTKAGGVVLGANGLDNAGTGAYELWTGHSRETMTNQAAQAAARALGANPGTARIVGTVVDIAMPTLVAGGLGAVRALSVRKGVIDLAAEEATGKQTIEKYVVEDDRLKVDLSAEKLAGGHTIEKHVGQSDEELLSRFGREPHITGSSTFFTLKGAEEAVSEALNAHRAAIEEWAKSGSERNFRRTFDTGRQIGRVIPKGAIKSQPATKIRFILRRSQMAGRTYFVARSPARA